MRRKKSNNPEGRPDEGKGEDQQLVRGPEILIEKMRRAARGREISINEAWRTAAEYWLGGLCSSGKHGLDFKGQTCDLCR